MNGKILLLGALLASTIATANAKEFGPGTHVVNGLIVTVPAGSKVTITAPTSVVTIGTTIPGPVTPGPKDPPDPSLSFKEALQASQDAIPAYADKVKDRQVIAFTLKFMSKVLPNDDEETDALLALKEACDAAVGDNAPKWADWWVTVGRHTAGCTNAGCKAFVADMALWLTDGLPAAANGVEASYAGEPIGGMSAATINELMTGVPTYGLDTRQGFDWGALLKILLPFLLKLLEGLF